MYCVASILWQPKKDENERYAHAISGQNSNPANGVARPCDADQQPVLGSIGYAYKRGGQQERGTKKRNTQLEVNSLTEVSPLKKPLGRLAEKSGKNSLKRHMLRLHKLAKYSLAEAHSADFKAIRSGITE